MLIVKTIHCESLLPGSKVQDFGMGKTLYQVTEPNFEEQQNQSACHVSEVCLVLCTLAWYIAPIQIEREPPSYCQPWFTRSTCSSNYLSVELGLWQRYTGRMETASHMKFHGLIQILMLRGIMDNE
jgi:hypothetical protein